jgi:anthranilate phosphoribosyltransferase
MTPQQALKEILAGRSLDRPATEELFGQLMDGQLSDAMKAGLLVALAMKGETAAEIAGAAAAMRRRVLHIPHGRTDLVDTCGTGGDGKGGFNVSTCAALVVASAGARVAKHGNRSVSSRSGCSDLLGALGLAVDLSPEDAARAIEEVGIAFLFAPRMHPAMKEVMPVRRELGMRTIFNLLGPVTNPAGARRQLVGVYAEPLVATIAEVLRELGTEHALVVHGDGYDEITTTGRTKVAEVRGGRIESYQLHPRDFGLAEVGPAQVAGGSPEQNAEAARRLLAGAPGPLADLVALNSGAAIYVAGLAPDIKTGVAMAQKLLEEGAPLRKLDQLKAFKAGAPEAS